jgi:PEP-CTERM motif
MKRLIALLTVAGSAAVLLASQPASAVTTVIGFDNVPEGTIATSQYTGVVFSGASVLTENSELNPAFPPKSDPNVVYDYLNGTITLDFTVPVSEIGAYVTGNFSITESIYDGATLLGTTATGGANATGAGTGLDPNIFLDLSSMENITSAVFTNNQGGASNTFTLDDVTVVSSTGIITNGVPEPSTWALMGLGFAGIGIAACRRSRKASPAVAAA